MNFCKELKIKFKIKKTRVYQNQYQTEGWRRLGGGLPQSRWIGGGRGEQGRTKGPTQRGQRGSGATPTWSWTWPCSHSSVTPSHPPRSQSGAAAPPIGTLALRKHPPRTSSQPYPCSQSRSSPCFSPPPFLSQSQSLSHSQNQSFLIRGKMFKHKP